MFGELNELDGRTVKHDCRGANWTMKICDAIESASEGDELLVATEAARELAEGARDRLRPGLGLAFRVEELPDPFA